jgi:hypothetical protein
MEALLHIVIYYSLLLSTDTKSLSRAEIFTRTQWQPRLVYRVFSGCI